MEVYTDFVRKKYLTGKEFILITGVSVLMFI